MNTLIELTSENQMLNTPFSVKNAYV